MGNPTASAASDQPFEPPAPRSIDDTGLHLLFLADLALKILYNVGSLTGLQVADRMKLPFNSCVDQVLEYLKREQLVEVKGSRRLWRAGLSVHHRQQRAAKKRRRRWSAASTPGRRPCRCRVYVKAMQQAVAEEFPRHAAGDARRRLTHMVLNRAA